MGAWVGALPSYRLPQERSGCPHFKCIAPHIAAAPVQDPCEGKRPQSSSLRTSRVPHSRHHRLLGWVWRCLHEQQPQPTVRHSIMHGCQHSTGLC